MTQMNGSVFTPPRDSVFVSCCCMTCRRVVAHVYPPDMSGMIGVAVDASACLKGCPYRPHQEMQGARR